MNAKTKKTLVIVAAAVLAVLIAFFAATEALLFVRMKQMSRQLASLTGESEWDVEENTQENDVLIADDYWIRSTTAISDAYKANSDAGLSADDKETLKMASAVLDEIITDGMTDYEKETAVFDWMVANLGYDEGALTVIPTSTQEQACPHGVLKNHDAVCVGYATTFRLFMEMLDIPCKVVHNSERFHSWDLVQLDGDWYHVDVYSAVNGGGYHYLNLSDSMMMQEEDWDTDYFPEADSLKYNYSYLNSIHVDSVYDLPMALRDAIAAGGDYWSFAFPCKDEGDYDVAQAMVDQLESRSNDAGGNEQAVFTGNGVWKNVWSYTQYSLLPADGDEMLLNVSYYSDEDSTWVNENVDYEQIQQAIDQAFGEGVISVRDLQSAK